MPKKSRKGYKQRLRDGRLKARRRLAALTPEKRKLRLQCRRENQRKRRASESAEKRKIRLCLDRERQRKVRMEKKEAQAYKERVRCLEEELASLKKAITLTYGARAISNVTKNLSLLQKTSSIVNDPERKTAEGITTKAASDVLQDVDPLSVASTSSAVNESCIPLSVLNSNIRKNNSKSNKETIKERRIIDVKHFFNKLKRANKHSKIGCSLNDIVIIGETKRGICTSYQLQCGICNYQTVVHSEIFSGEKDLNIDMIEVMLNLNCDFDGINKLLDALCLPSLSAEFFDKQLSKLKKVIQKATSQSTDSPTSCIINGKSPKNFRKSSALKPASLTSRELDEISLHQTAKVPQIKTDQRANSPVTCSENNKVLPKTSEQNLQSATYQTSIPPKTANQQTFIHKNLLEKASSKNTQIEGRVITLHVQKNMSSASSKSKNLHKNNSVGFILVEDQIEIKEEENASGDVSELLTPDQITGKTSSNELNVSQEQLTLNMVHIKQEINSELNNECNLPLMDFNNMQIIDEESKIDCNINMSEEELQFFKKTGTIIDESEVVVDQNLNKLGEKKVEQKYCLVENCTKSLTKHADKDFTVLPQQKEIMSYENRMIINPNQIELYQSGAIHEDTRLVEFRCLEKKDKGRVTDFDNLSEVELPLKKIRTTIQECKVIINQDDIKLCKTETERNLYSVKNCEIFSKPKTSEKKRTMNKKRFNSSYEAESGRIANDQKMLLSVYERNGENLCRANMNNFADTKGILMSASNKKKENF